MIRRPITSHTDTVFKGLAAELERQGVSAGTIGSYRLGLGLFATWFEETTLAFLRGSSETRLGR